VKVNDYIDLVETLPPLEQKMKGYHVCLAAVFSVLMVRYPGHEHLHVILEAQAQTKYWEMAQGLFRCFRQICEVTHPFFDTIYRVQKEESPLTEPADFLAFATAKNLDEPGTIRAEYTRPILEQISSGPALLPGMVMNRERARQNVRDVLRDSREKVVERLVREKRWPPDVPIQFVD
jgi:hypothetical protein